MRRVGSGAQRRRYTALHRRGSLLAGEAVEEGVLSLRVMMEKEDQLLDVLLAHGVQLDRSPQAADRATYACVITACAVHGGAVPLLQERPKELLFHVHVGEQPMLELAPNDLQVLARKRAEVVHEASEEVVEHAVICGELRTNGVHPADSSNLYAQTT